MTPTPLPVAFRAYTVRKSPHATETAPPPPPSGNKRRTARDEPRWPKYVLVFDTETTADAVQRLMFGCYRVLRWGRDGTLELVEEGLFAADDLGEWNAEALATLKRYALANGLRLLTRRAFLDTVFRRIAIELRGLVVGFNLPFDLSRLAISSGEARGDTYRGGFTFALFEYFDKKRQRWAEHVFRPRVCVKSLDSKRAFIGFTRPLRTDKAEPRAFRGHFLDLRTLAFALSAKSHSLDSACRAFGVEHGKLAVEEHGRVTPEYIDYNRRDALATQELLVRLREEFDALEINVPPTRIYSPASIAKASIKAMGVAPLRTKASAISDAEIGRTMTAFYGGRAECRVRRVAVPVQTVDFRSMYPSVNCLLGLWGILTAERVRFVDCTEEMRALLANASPSEAFKPALWPQLRGFVELSPDGDVLPVRARYSGTSDALNIGVNYLTSSLPLTYAAPDVYASALLTGKAPTIRRAWRLEGDGMQPGLKPFRLGGKILIDPRRDDFFRTLIEERVRVKNSTDIPPAERERIAQLLKITANSGAYGIFAEMNREELPADSREPIAVFGHGEPFEDTTNAPEELGEFCFPPVAALISAAARLMLALLERCVTDTRGHYAFCDTDSMAIIATEFGGLVECEGGTDDPTDRIEAVRALTWGNVQAIRARFNALNPYDPAVIPSILNIEDVNFQEGEPREVSAYAISAKRYALFRLDSDGRAELLRCSEHGLGHLLSPLPENSSERWPEVLWKLILAEEFGNSPENPAWLRFPAASRVSVSSPAYFRGFLRREAEKPYPERIKPYGFLISAQVARFGHPEGANPKKFHLLAPFSKHPRKWVAEFWADTYSGVEYLIATALSYLPGIVRVKSLADVKAEFLAHGEMKSAAANGLPAGAASRGILCRRHVSPSEIRLIGKESNSLELVAAGMLSEWSAIQSEYSKNAPPSTEVLHGQPAAAIARAWNVSVRTVRSWRAKASKRPQA